MHLFTQAWFGGVSMAYQLFFYTVIAQKEGQRNALSRPEVAGNIMI